MSATSPYRLTFLQALRLQIDVIGALIMRESETRYGHHRTGIIWMFAEPLLLGLAVSVIKVYMGYKLPPGVPILMYGIICYLPFYMFRALIGRSSGALQANMTLLFHRNVTLLDVMIARSTLELMSIIGVVVIIELAAGFMIGHWPAKPMTLIAALLLMALLGHGLGMMVAALTAAYEGIERLVHMFTYLMMPLSGAMFMLETVPPAWRDLLLWVPLPNIHEMARDGQFGTLLIHHYDVSYIVYWVIGTNLLGMLALRAIRPKLTVFG
ncbi:ABC transporter permease [Acetobacteraceae bacterium H6797]|nr:ABC transporter permease [Acetobacteraceae bacterium H6797]